MGERRRSLWHFKFGRPRTIPPPTGSCFWLPRSVRTPGILPVTQQRTLDAILSFSIYPIQILSLPHPDISRICPLLCFLFPSASCNSVLFLLSPCVIPNPSFPSIDTTAAQEILTDNLGASLSPELKIRQATYSFPKHSPSGPRPCEFLFLESPLTHGCLRNSYSFFNAQLKCLWLWKAFSEIAGFPGAFVTTLKTRSPPVLWQQACELLGRWQTGTEPLSFLCGSLARGPADGRCTASATPWPTHSLTHARTLQHPRHWERSSKGDAHFLLGEGGFISNQGLKQRHKMIFERSKC